MKLCCNTWIPAAIALLAGGLITATVMSDQGGRDAPKAPSSKDVTKAAQDATDAAKKAAEDAVKKAEDAMGGMSEEEMMKAMMEFAAPGEQHKWIKDHMVGSWDLALTYWMAPNTEAQTMTASSVANMAMGDMYMIENVNGTIDMGGGMTMPFEGMSVMSFDKTKQKFYSLWFDNMIGGNYWAEWGDAAADGKSLTVEGENFDAMAGGTIHTKSVVKITGPDSRELEMWKPGPDGAMFKHMVIVYTRKK